jgi:hypothetical protein
LLAAYAHAANLAIPYAYAANLAIPSKSDPTWKFHLTYAQPTTYVFT